MKKLLISYLILITSLCFTSFALAGGADDAQMPMQPAALYAVENGPYFGIHGGVNFASQGGGTGFDVGAQVGYRFMKYLRVEAAYTYLRNDVNMFGFNAHLNSHLLMFNALYDTQLTSVIDPFIGFGIGLDHLSAFGPYGNGSENNFAYQAIAGIGFTITHNTMLSARYRFVGTAGSGDFHYNILEASFDYFI